MENGLMLRVLLRWNAGRSRVHRARCRHMYLTTTSGGAWPAWRGTAAARRVDFAASGSPRRSRNSQRGVAALHSFLVRRGAGGVSIGHSSSIRTSPMAWWGIAMTYHRPYLPGSDDAAGRAALARRVVTPAAHPARGGVHSMPCAPTMPNSPGPAARSLMPPRWKTCIVTIPRTPRRPRSMRSLAAGLRLVEPTQRDSAAAGADAAAVAAEVYRRNPPHTRASPITSSTVSTTPALASARPR